MRFKPWYYKVIGLSGFVSFLISFIIGITNFLYSIMNLTSPIEWWVGIPFLTYGIAILELLIRIENSKNRNKKAISRGNKP